METRKLAVREVTGPTCLSPEKGERVYRILQAGVDAGQMLELDFAGVDLFATPFFNLSIGQLLRNHDPALVRSRVRMVNLNEVGHDTYTRAWDNAVHTYHAGTEDRGRH